MKRATGKAGNLVGNWQVTPQVLNPSWHWLEQQVSGRTPSSLGVHIQYWNVLGYTWLPWAKEHRIEMKLFKSWWASFCANVLKFCKQNSFLQSGNWLTVATPQFPPGKNDKNIIYRNIFFDSLAEPFVGKKASIWQATWATYLKASAPRSDSSIQLPCLDLCRAQHFSCVNIVSLASSNL